MDKCKCIKILLNAKVRNPKSRLLHLVSEPWLGRLGRHSKAPIGLGSRLLSPY